MSFDDLSAHMGRVTRTVTDLERDGKPARRITLKRGYDATPEDLWDAITNPDRLPRWFAPVSGAFEPGGRYQVEGNAGGTITRCDPPRALDLTWEFGGDVSWVEARIAAEGADSRLTLSHIAVIDDHHWPTYGPGAAGVGWDLALVGLSDHVSDPDADRIDEAELAASSEGKALILDVSRAWGRAAIAAGEDTADAEAAARRTAAFYMGDEAAQV